MFPEIKKYYREPLYRNSFAIMLNAVFSSFFGLLFWIVAARTMPSTTIGLATAAISAAALVFTLSRLGLDTGLTRFLPRSQDRDALYSTVLFITLIFALAFTAMFLSVIGFVSPQLVFLRQGGYLLVFLGYAAIYAIFSTQNNALVSLRRGDLFLVQNLLFGLRVPILFTVVGLGVLGIFTSYDIALLVTLAFGAYVLFRYGLSFRFKANTTSLREIMTFSLGNYIAGIFVIIPVSVMPVLIVNTVGAQGSAYFYVAYSVAALLSAIPTAVSTSLFVEGSHDMPMRENVVKSLKFVLLLLIPALLFVLVFGDKLLLLFSKEYSDQAFGLLRLLAISSVFTIVPSIYITIKRIQKDVRMITYVSFAISMLIVALGYVSLITVGLLGLGYVWIAANAVVSTIAGWLIVRREKWI
ncbi:MAG: MATE family efflux transporter [Halobacteriota archaeon]